MRYVANIITCITLILLGIVTGLLITSFITQKYETLTFKEFQDYLNNERITSIEIDKDKIIAVTRKKEEDGNFSASEYKVIPLNEKDRVIKALEEKPEIPLYKPGDYTNIESYYILIPLLLLFAVIGAIVMASRRGNIKETLFKEKKFTLESPLQKERLNSVTWQNLMSGEPLKIVAAYGDLSSAEQDNYLLLLLKAIQSEDLEVRRNGSFALREIGDERTVLTLCKMLQEDEDAHVRMNVAMTLGIIKDEVAIESLKHAVKDPNPLVRCAIATALGAIADEECLEILSTMLEEDDNWRARRSAVMALMKIRNDKSLEKIIEALRDEEPVVRSSAAIALGDLGVTEAVRDLSVCLSEDKEPSVRRDIIKSLHSIGGPEVIEPLCKVIKSDEDENVRLSAISALELVDDEMVLETLCEALKNDKEPDVRLFAAEALSIRQDKAVEEAFRRAIYDSDEMVKEFVEGELKSRK